MVFISCVMVDFWVCVCVQIFGNIVIDLDSLVNCCFMQCLCIGVYCEEFNIFNVFVYYVFNGVIVVVIDVDDFNYCVVGQFYRFKYSFFLFCVCCLRMLIVCVFLKN